MNAIKQQFDAMLKRGVMPYMEYQTSADDWVLVTLSYDDKGVTFSFDSDNKPVSFDGEIVEYNDCFFCLPYDEYSDDLDYYLQMIDQNITEGFLLPNDLYYCEA